MLDDIEFPVSLGTLNACWKLAFLARLAKKRPEGREQTMNLHRALVSLAIPALTVALGGVVEAGIVVTIGPGGGNPDENVLYNKSGLVTSGSVVQGATNQTDRVVDITPNQAITLNAAGGQARIEQLGGAAFNGAMFTPHSANNLPAGLNVLGAFTDFKFNVNATVNGLVDIVVNGLNSSNAAISQSLLGAPLDKNGENFFRIIADSGDVITKVTVTANGDIIQEFKQVRLGGLVGPDLAPIPGPPVPDPPPVPEPTSILVWGVLAAAGAALRLRRPSAPAI